MQFLTRRFGAPGRLRDLPPLATFGPAEVLYSGAVSFYRVSREEGGRVRLETLAAMRHRDRLQHVVRSAANGATPRTSCWPASSTVWSAGACALRSTGCGG